jgi:hypothetical protein
MTNVFNLPAPAPALELRFAPTTRPAYPDGIPYCVAPDSPLDEPPVVTAAALDARARRAARACGYVARKSRWRRDSIDNYGGFMLVDPATSFSVTGFRYDLSAEAVIEWCADWSALPTGHALPPCAAKRRAARVATFS